MDKLIKNRKLRLLLACISLLLLVDMIQDSYAKYVSSAEANSNLTIAMWSFMVNNQDVISNSNFSATIVPVIDANPHVASGVIAPTSTGYFDITIDSSNVGVSYDEQITLTTGTGNTVTDLIFTGYKLNNNSVVQFQNTSSPTFTTTHLLSEQNRVNTYRFYIEWRDGQNETMNNSADTQASANGTAKVNVNLRFIQKASS